MKVLARACLRLATLALPVIVACSPARFSREGRVIDKDTHGVLAGVEVQCVLGSGTVEDTETSGADGSFILWFDTACDHLHAHAPSVGDGGSAVYGDLDEPYTAGTGSVALQMSKSQ